MHHPLKENMAVVLKKSQLVDAFRADACPVLCGDVTCCRKQQHLHAVDVAGIHNNDFASFGRIGYHAAFSFHHDNGFSFLDSGCSPKYIRISLRIA